MAGKKAFPAWAALAILAAAVVLIASSAYIVAEHEQAIVTEFGRPVGGPVTRAGLHWKKPFVQSVHRFEKRLLEHDGEKTEIPTKDKKFIQLDTFARWRIVDPLLFFQSVRTEIAAKMKLDDIIDSETRDSISNNYLIEAVRNSNRPLLRDAEVIAAGGTVGDASGTPPVVPGTVVFAPTAASVPASVPTSEAEPTEIVKGRQIITREVLESAQRKMKEFGIELVDVRIKSINYVSRVQERVFDRMVSEREQIAEKYRAEGEKIFAEVQGTIAKERDRILSEAYREAETRKGEAEAEAARIYAEAYGKDPEFYRFWKSLEIYREGFGDNVSLVIGSDSDFFRYFRTAAGEPGASAGPPATGTPPR